MGTVEVIPSISSSTIALLTGIYTDLLCAIHAFDRSAWQLLIARKWKLLWQRLHGNFLLPICFGIILSLLSTVRLVSYLLVQYPIETWSFFGGLSLVAVVSVYRKIQNHTWLTWGYSLLGLSVSCVMIYTDLVITSHAPWALFVSGVLAACAMILPGISGSFLLLILGQYTYVLHALKNFDWAVLSIFITGGVVGIFGVSRLVLQLLRHYADAMMAIVAGFMLGSLYQLWPWKNHLVVLQKNASQYTSSTQNILPSHFKLLYDQDPHIPQALLCCFLGCLAVTLLTKWGMSQRRQ